MGSHRRSRFRINKADKKVMGVCAGIADHFEVDVTLVRVAAALVILSTMPVGAIVYLVLGMVADETGERRRADRVDRARGEAAEQTRERVRDLDVRLAALETSVKDQDSALAREIEALR